MSNTPRTDAAMFDSTLLGPNSIVRVGFARQLERENAELRRDAERYRFLRIPGRAIVYAKDRDAWGSGQSGHVRYDAPEQLDAAVDAALQKVTP
jgi:hypothetical protein